ncbi:MAG: right-handed parallel beta-helix repeat-containing protein [Sandaracinaceae bacterium]|nr:right-handed parallel beta-helix repeat-containing protein [Sandaracinaceae bacterium]
MTRRSPCLPACLFALASLAMLGALALLSPSRVLAQRTLHVAVDGDDAGDGSEARPFASVSRASLEVGPGDTVLVHGGTYHDVIEPPVSGEEGRPITYRAVDGEEVVLDGVGSEVEGVVGIGWSLRDGYESRPTSYVVIEGFTIRYPHVFTGSEHRFGYVHVASTGSHDNVIRRCHIELPGDPAEHYGAGMRQAGVLITDAEHTTVEDSVIRGMWLGVWIAGGTTRFNVVRRNLITEMGSSALDIGDPGTGSRWMQGNLIEDNVLFGGVNEDAVQFEPNYSGSCAVASNRGTILRGNVMRGFVENAMDLKGAAFIVIERNVVFANEGDNDGVFDEHDRLGGMGGIIHGGCGNGEASTSTDVVVRFNVFYDNFGVMELDERYHAYNNTFVANNRDYTGPNSRERSCPGFTAALTYGGSGQVFVNNIVTEHDDAELSLNPRGMRDFAVDHNLYANAAGVRFFDMAGGHCTELDLDAWRALLESAGAEGAESHSVIGDPMFVDAPARPVGEGFDFHLREGSPAIDAGRTLTRAASAGSGSELAVLDAGFFSDGFGVTAGDAIVVGGETAIVVAIDHDASVLTLDRSLSWDEGTVVTLPFVGSAPDIGAFELGASDPVGPRPDAGLGEPEADAGALEGSDAAVPPGLDAGVFVGRGDAGLGGSDAGTHRTSPTSACGCRASRADTGGVTWLVLAGLGLVVVRRRARTVVVCARGSYARPPHEREPS